LIKDKKLYGKTKEKIIMKKFWSMFFLSIFLANGLFATQEMNYVPDLHIDPSIALKKIYVQPTHIHIIPEGIFFVNHEGYLEHACGVFHDAGGSYVMAKENMYKCPRCNQWSRGNSCKNQACPLYGKLACQLNQ
jgi:hypothetical protein